jgi:putative spermidine/putrescine transport system permease protein
VFTLGQLGVITTFLRENLGFNIYDAGFKLSDKFGLELVYLYFQIPLMILIIAPAVDGLKKEWREAAENMGASSGQYWRRVALPILTPSILGTMILLFGNAFGAQATAYQLTGGALPLATLVISSQISGDVLHNPGLGYAVAMTMIVIMAVSIGLYTVLQRRSERWLRS